MLLMQYLLKIDIKIKTLEILKVFLASKKTINQTIFWNGKNKKFNEG